MLFDFQLIIYLYLIKRAQNFYKYIILNPQTMEKLLIKLESIEAKVHSLRKTCKQNNLDTNLLNGFNTKKMRDIHTRVIRHYKDNPQKGKTLWFESQLKLFNWVLISFSLFFQKKIQNFTDSEWDFFKQIFTSKDIYTFKYESKRLLNENQKNPRVWNFEEDSILTTIIEDKQMKNRWNQVARKFYQLSNQRHFRTGKQCRQHWFNHLDPSKKHGKWNVQQDLIILKFVFSNGKKWSSICKDELPHRTEHMIKNRYKSLLTKSQKRCQESTNEQNVELQKLIRKFEGSQHNELSTLKEFRHQISQNYEVLRVKQQQKYNVKIQREESVIDNSIVSEFNSKQQFNKNGQMEGIDIPKNATLEVEQVTGLICINPALFNVFYQPYTMFIPTQGCWTYFNSMTPQK